MDDLIEQVTRGNVTEVKMVLASIIVALAVYQVFLMAVGYGKLRLPNLKPKAASFTHRAVGDTLVVLTLKMIVVRWWHSPGRLLPHFGLTVFSLFVIVWISSTGDYLWPG